MGQYAASLAIPANTLEGDKINTTILVHEPFIVGYEVFFPTGCAGLCYVAIKVGGKQFAPADGSADRYFHGEGSKTWYGKARLATGQTETEIKIIGYNIDDTYLHTPIISINTDQA
jgi:hypothetical protein